MGKLTYVELRNNPNLTVWSWFHMSGSNYEALVYVPLVSDERWDVGYADYNAASPESKYIYESGKNGIAARVILEPLSPSEYKTDVRFVYDGAYYIVRSLSLKCETRELAESIIAAFIDDFAVVDTETSVG